jgi:hypothetical protein
MPAFYRNIKTGDLYKVLDGSIMDATNATEGRMMVLYKDAKGKKYTREEKEFGEKFKKVSGRIKF